MRPASNSTTNSVAEAGFGHWNSPIPYVFGGLALVLGLIATALIILGCSYKRSSSPSSETTQEKGKEVVEVMKEDMEPKVVVIMAGDVKPTYLAKPVPCSCPSHDEQV